MSKTDELKVYTGKEALQALLEGKTIQCVDPKIKYKIEDNTLYQEGFTGWSISDLQLIDFLNLEFTEVVTPQVGDWVRVNVLANTYIGQIERIAGKRFYSHWNNQKDEKLLVIDNEVDWEILSPEQVSEYKREQAFVKVGRKLNEFRSGDIVYVDHEGVIGIVVSKSNSSEIKVNECNRVQGWSAKPHQLTPISFIEQQVDLS